MLLHFAAMVRRECAEVVKAEEEPSKSPPSWLEAVDFRSASFPSYKVQTNHVFEANAQSLAPILLSAAAAVPDRFSS